MNKGALALVGAAAAAFGIAAAVFTALKPPVVLTLDLTWVLLATAVVVGIVYSVGQYSARTREPELTFTPTKESPVRSMDVTLPCLAGSRPSP